MSSFAYEVIAKDIMVIHLNLANKRRCDDEENLICTCGDITIHCGLNRAVLRLVYTLEAFSLYYWRIATHRPLRRFKPSIRQYRGKSERGCQLKMPSLDSGFTSKQEKMNRDLERLLYWQEHGTHASYVGIHALKSSDVFTATRIISADIASNKLRVKGHETNTVMNDVLDLFNNNPHSDLPGWHFKFIIIANMLLNGQSFVEIIRDKNDFPVGFHFLHNDLVGIEEKDG